MIILWRHLDLTTRRIKIKFIFSYITSSSKGSKIKDLVSMIGNTTLQNNPSLKREREKVREPKHCSGSCGD